MYVYRSHGRYKCQGADSQVTRFMLTVSARGVITVFHICDRYFHRGKMGTSPRSTMQERMNVCVSEAALKSLTNEPENDWYKLSKFWKKYYLRIEPNHHRNESALLTVISFDCI